MLTKNYNYKNEIKKKKKYTKKNTIINTIYLNE
jgi:hypothetical protein